MLRRSVSVLKTALALMVMLLVLLSLPAVVAPKSLSSIALLGSSAQQTAYEIIQHPLPKGSTEPWAIATDSMGRVWFVQQGSNQLGMLDPATNNITEFSIPTPQSTSISVAVDGEGNVWFTELTSNRLGELKNGSTNIIEYPIPGGPYLIGGQTQFQACGPTGVVPDSLGHIWILCEFSNQIDEFFPGNGAFFGFDLPVYQSAPAGLVFDHQGNFWFTAADANMIGQGILSELRNGTSAGITEFAPVNPAYIFTFQHAQGPEGSYYSNSSSLPTPSGIALSGNTLWITEHVDSSFDSYNIESKSFERYWTSKTNGAFGYGVSFPNGIAVDEEGNVWISEHYGNKIAEFNPSTNSLTEYIVPCCGNASAGTYTLALGKDGTVWFVEIGGNAIGELKPVPANQTFSLALGSSNLNLDSSGSVNIPVTLMMNGEPSSQNVSFDISGISSTGELSGASAEFNPKNVRVTSSGNTTSLLTLKTEGLAQGIYYLTISATVSPEGVIHSQILRVVISNYTGLLTYAFVVGVISSVVVIGLIAFKMGRKRRPISYKRSARRR